ncbi:hypothetical protein AAC387_Pa04g2470 [Persea americana]
MPRMGLMLWIDRKIVEPLVQILQRGAEPKQLAFSAALGITLGIFPICGVTVILCGMAIALLGTLCHAPSVMLANFIATPIELSLVVPFLRFGEVISGGPHFPLTSDALKKVVTGQASREVLFSIFHAKCSALPSSPKKPFYPNAEVKLKRGICMAPVKSRNAYKLLFSLCCSSSCGCSTSIVYLVACWMIACLSKGAAPTIAAVCRDRFEQIGSLAQYSLCVAGHPSYC